MANEKLPRLYLLSRAEILTMPISELAEVQREYREFWRGAEGHSNRTQNSDYQADWLEDRDGTYR